MRNGLIGPVNPARGSPRRYLLDTAMTTSFDTPHDDVVYAPLKLKKGEERRLRAGHLWTYSNEVDVDATPLKNLAPGQPVEIIGHNGKPLGTGYANPHSLICARLVSRDPHHPFTPSLIVHRLKVALSLRQRLYSAPFYRLVFGEADGLPGVIIDRYGEVVVAQITTAGMELMKEALLAGIIKVLNPKAVLWRNDSPIRELEGLAQYVEPALGEIPDLVEIEENGLRFGVDLIVGQKTGWFFDQRDNRRRLERYVQGRRVLDAFCYSGGWGIAAAAYGAKAVTCIDSSETALKHAHANAERNGVTDKMSYYQGDVLTVMKALRQEEARFDVVVVDPPAFIKRKKESRDGMIAYRRLNEMAIRLLDRDGILVSCSCSQHFTAADLQGTLLQASRHIDRQLTIVERGHQAADHPVHPAITETDYLKAFYCRVVTD